MAPALVRLMYDLDMYVRYRLKERKGDYSSCLCVVVVRSLSPEDSYIDQWLDWCPSELVGNRQVEEVLSMNNVESKCFIIGYHEDRGLQIVWHFRLRHYGAGANLN